MPVNSQATRKELVGKRLYHTQKIAGKQLRQKTCWLNRYVSRKELAGKHLRHKCKEKLTTHYSLLTTDMPRTKNMLVHGLATHKELPGKQYAIIHGG